MFKTEFKLIKDIFCVRLLRNNNLRTWNITNDSKLFQKKYRQDFLDLVYQYFHESCNGRLKLLENNVNMTICLIRPNVVQVEVYSAISNISKLIEVFADKRLRDQITREAFRYV